LSSSASRKNYLHQELGLCVIGLEEKEELIGIISGNLVKLYL